MKTLIPLLLLWAAGQSAPASDGTIRVTIPDGLPERVAVHVFRVGSGTEEAKLLEYLLSGLASFSTFFTPTVVDRQGRIENKAWILSVPPGAYHVRIGGTDTRSAVWHTSVKVAAGETREFAFDPRKFGTVKGTWSVDSARQPGSRQLVSLKGALVRDGKVWARTESKEGNVFELKGVPPGDYSLVLEEFFEEFLWVHDNVRVGEGQEAKVSVAVKRAELGGLMVELSAAGKPLSDLSYQGAIIVDGRNRFAGKAGVWMSSDPNAPSGLMVSQYPMQGDYTLHFWKEGFAPVEKKGLKLRPPAKPDPKAFILRESYPVLKLPLTPAPAGSDKKPSR